MPALLTAAEAAEYLRGRPETIYRWMRNGELESIRFKGTVRVPARALEALVGDHNETEEAR